MDNNTLYWVWLASLSGIFANKVNALTEHFETIEDIYKADISEYKKIPGITRGDSLVLNSKDLTHAREIVEKTQKAGANILTYDDIRYPDSLRKIPNPPYVLYIKGEIMPWDRLLCIGVVGTRKCSEYGVNATNHIAYGLALKGITIVSGMARGIDTAAACAALKAGNKTIAVLGSGIDVVYPPENAKLMDEITKHGAVITEYPPGSAPLKAHFPERNRIISGLSRGILVSEAPEVSGALITARYALETGRDLFVVPGSIFSYNSRGSNNLLKEAAKATMCAEDILEEYPFDVEKLVPPDTSMQTVNNIRTVSIDDERYAKLGENEKKIISLLIESNLHIDEIQAKTSIEIATLNSLLPLLEMMGLIRKLPGDNYKLEY